MIPNYWLSLIPLMVVCIFFLILAGVFSLRCAIYGRPRTEQIENRRGTGMILSWFMEYWFWIIKPIERFLVRIRCSPNVLTGISVALSIAAGVAFHLGHFGLGGWLMIFGGTFDIFDGRIARQLGMQSYSGAYMDSIVDRYGEAAVFIGLASYYRHETWVLLVILVALMGSFMVSYSRARGEALGIVCERGRMMRGERIFFIGVGSALSPFVDVWIAPGAEHPFYYLAVAMLILVAVMANLTAFGRTVFIYRRLKAGGTG